MANVRTFVIYLIVAENVQYLERPAANSAATRVFRRAITADCYIVSWVRRSHVRTSREYFCTRATRNSDNDVAVFVRDAVAETAPDATVTAFFLVRAPGETALACLRGTWLFAIFHSIRALV